ncbi:MAG TPA: gliding motility-associated ABC transporter permease subunit GldF, partial [Flavobacterium sp.]
FYFGFEGLIPYLSSMESVLSYLGMDSHFRSMGRGVIDTRDIIYFVSISTLFLAATVYKLKSLKS